MGGFPRAARHQIKTPHKPSRKRIVAKELQTPSFTFTIVFMALRAIASS
jgi:hypothetical protein